MSSDCIAHKKGFQPVEAFLTCQSDSFMSMKPKMIAIFTKLVLFVNNNSPEA